MLYGFLGEARLSEAEKTPPESSESSHCKLSSTHRWLGSGQSDCHRQWRHRVRQKYTSKFGRDRTINQSTNQSIDDSINWVFHGLRFLLARALLSFTLRAMCYFIPKCDSNMSLRSTRSRNIFSKPGTTKSAAPNHVGLPAFRCPNVWPTRRWTSTAHKWRIKFGLKRQKPHIQG